MADDDPGVPYASGLADRMPGRLELGRVFCVESLNGARGSWQDVRLETQVLVTEDGFERLDSVPWETPSSQSVCRTAMRPATGLGVQRSWMTHRAANAPSIAARTTESHKTRAT
jgi:hypothetical protein